jgi:hypothetical protein
MTSAWERFWFGARPTSSLALLRIAFGVVAFLWTVTLGGDLTAFFTHGGLLPSAPAAPGWWSVLYLDDSTAFVEIVWVLLALSCLALVLGWHSRLAAVLVFVGITSFERRNVFVTNGGDGLLRIISFYMMFAPTGAALSLDRLRRCRERFWEFPTRSAWPMRLMQVQLSVIYLSSVWIKVQGVDWDNGTAVSIAMRMADVRALPLPSFLIHSVILSNFLTYGTLLMELSLAILIWIPRLRLPVLLAGVGLHVGIGYTFRVGFFSLGMLALYLAFLDPDWASNWILALRARWLKRSGRTRMREPVAVAAEPER